MQDAAMATTEQTGREARWRAVLARDARWDGRFVFGVRTTGVYCRPSCPARRPLRANVVFFDHPAAAEVARFRACRRCRPGQVDPRTELVRRACRRLDEEDLGPLRLADLATAVGSTPRRLTSAFRDLLGVTPRQYAAARRMAGFKRRVREGGNLTTALYDAGFGSSSRLYEDVQERMGMTPRAYRDGGAGLRVAFTVAESPLGRVLVATTPRGIAAVTLGASAAELEAALRAEYPRAAVERDDRELAGTVRTVLDAIAGRAEAEDLPLDVRATAFQHQVWRELRKIPRGRTRSYGEVARRLGRPTAARAVARACASNRVAVLVPCHRVVAGDGSLGGYRWGTARKRALLEKEGALGADEARAKERPRARRRA
jgi:AraC family transcriptional regulator of adaptative response/methylated-DNA-[protein]-cysteine methyltransferase